MIYKEKFGAFIRQKRQARKLGLREMAKMIGISPTYLSKCERDEFNPPAEDKVRQIATIFGCDADDLLARANRVSTDITDIIKHHPVELTALLRTAKGMNAENITGLTNQLVRDAQKMDVVRAYELLLQAAALIKNAYWVSTEAETLATDIDGYLSDAIDMTALTIRAENAWIENPVKNRG